jgi:hypothetical protein
MHVLIFAVMCCAMLQDAGFVFGYDEPLSHMIYAAADIMLVPSMFEPCGLTQVGFVAGLCLLSGKRGRSLGGAFILGGRGNSGSKRTMLHSCVGVCFVIRMRSDTAISVFISSFLQAAC